jgi:hypothetical protein
MNETITQPASLIGQRIPKMDALRPTCPTNGRSVSPRTTCR